MFEAGHGFDASILDMKETRSSSSSNNNSNSTRTTPGIFSRAAVVAATSSSPNWTRSTGHVSATHGSSSANRQRHATRRHNHGDVSGAEQHGAGPDVSMHRRHRTVGRAGGASPGRAQRNTVSFLLRRGFFFRGLCRTERCRYRLNRVDARPYCPRSRRY